eukprot:TRINITY_DN7187_c0_g1_i1.p1 TRINITY_DN7187_c0_g1~~TRINITY_DN7187_c0_g1_i1.p1  ORF type:complete len:719 (+),score=148.22 TRINITY_DN7187_c0_g1_i1:2439-4595(+)
MQDVAYDHYDQGYDQNYYEENYEEEEGGYDYDANYNDGYANEEGNYDQDNTFAPGTSPDASTSDDDKEKIARLRKHAMEEIVATEASYLQDLYTLILYYVTPLRNGRFPEISASSKGDVTMLFSTIELIFDGNTELLNDLKAQIELPEPMIGEVFLKRCDQLMTYYGVYCNHQKEAMDQIQQCITTSENFRKFIDSCKAKPETRHLGLIDFVVKPFQRILKYPLLLDVLFKYTPNGHPDKPNIEQALAKVQTEVDVINSNKAKNDNLKKMLEINTAVESMPRTFKFLIPSRVFIYEGTLMKISGNHDQERHFILFNDCLMYSKKKSPGKFICRGIIFLNKLNIENMSDEVSFRLNRTDKNLTYVLYGKNPKEKEIWMMEINRLKQRATNPDSMKKTPSTGEPKETVKIYIPDGTFKTVVVFQSSLSQDIARELAKKTKMPDPGPTMTYAICLRHQGKERVLTGDEKTYDIIQQLVRQGAKFGDQSASHFKLMLTQNLATAAPVAFAPSHQNSAPIPVNVVPRGASPPGPRIGSSPDNINSSGSRPPPPARRGPRPPPGGPPPGTMRVVTMPPQNSAPLSVSPTGPKRNTVEFPGNPKGTLSPPPRRPPAQNSVQRSPTVGTLPTPNRPAPPPQNLSASMRQASRPISPPQQRALSPNQSRPSPDAPRTLSPPPRRPVTEAFQEPRALSPGQERPAAQAPRATVSGRVVPNRPLPPAPM